MNRFNILSTILVFVFLFHQSFARRELSTTVNPNCDQYEACKISPNTTKLIYIESSGNQTYHFLWAFIDHYAPVLFFFQTEESSSKLAVNWSSLLEAQPGAIKFEGGQVVKSFGFEITDLYFANFTTNETLHDLNVTSIRWQSKQKDASKSHVGYSFSTTLDWGSIDLNLDAFDSASQGGETPHMPYDVSTTLMRLLADNITLPKYIRDANHTTPFLYADYTTVWGNKQDATLNREVTIDDEYSPGVFERYTYNIKSSKQEQTAYLDWKTVAYFDSSLTFTKSVAILNPDFLDQKELESKTLLNCYFDGDANSIKHIRRMIFGNTDEDYDYDKDRYVDFSMALGLGEPPAQSFSFILKIIIFAGFGVPMVFFLFSIGYTVWRKLRASHYDNLNIDSDIF